MNARQRNNANAVQLTASLKPQEISGGYSEADSIRTWLTSQIPGLAFEVGPQFTRARLETSESEMLIRNCEPVRMQLVKELRRVADHLQYMAETILDTDYSPAECSNFHRDLKTLAWLPKPPANLLAETQIASPQ